MEIFWIDLVKPPSGLGLGVGITANDEADARSLLAAQFGALDIDHIRQDQSVDELEANHVRPNMGNILRRGIWFPNYLGVT